MTAPTAQSLYSREILRLAMSLPHDDRIDRIDGSATRRSPVCGSEMSVDVALTDGSISAVAVRARACALGQASAAVLRAEAIGRTLVELAETRAQIEDALTAKGEMPPAWAALAYARDYPARHGAILLPFDTLIAAMAEAGA